MHFLRRAARPALTLIRPEGTVAYIGGSDSLPPPLNREEETELFTRMKEEPDAVRQTLIEHNLRLVVYIARKFENTGVGIEDLISIGTIGLIKAVNTFDPAKKIKLATYASRCIENEILMFLRRTSRQKLEVSLDEPLNTDWDGNELLLSDVLGTEGDMVYRSIEETVERQMLSLALSRLSIREKEIMRLRFGLGGGQEKTQKEVADIMGISQSYISRLEKRILSRLHRDMVQMG
ncbi:MAG: RNA polymerase sporulation sigma factor SigE [Clostridia bacterium]|nr:RNA polymerase sporulation sigma factor SigE [Clostridia bacterium]